MEGARLALIHARVCLVLPAACTQPYMPCCCCTVLEQAPFNWWIGGRMRMQARSKPSMRRAPLSWPAVWVWHVARLGRTKGGQPARRGSKGRCRGPCLTVQGSSHPCSILAQDSGIPMSRTSTCFTPFQDDDCLQATLANESHGSQAKHCMVTGGQRQDTTGRSQPHATSRARVQKSLLVVVAGSGVAIRPATSMYILWAKANKAAGGLEDYLGFMTSRGGRR